MTEFNIVKLQSSGNSFIVCLVDQTKRFEGNIKQMCDPRYGVGGDGVVLIRPQPDGNNYELSFFNNDGSQFKMCFNGTLCAALFLKRKFNFESCRLYSQYIGEMEARFPKENVSITFRIPKVSIAVEDISMTSLAGIGYSLSLTDSHRVILPDSSFFSSDKFVAVAKKLRRGSKMFPHGFNVHFVSVDDNNVYIRHFEKGIETETLSCGSGCVAAAIILAKKRKLNFISPGGKLYLNKVKKHTWVISGQPQFISGLVFPAE